MRIIMSSNTVYRRNSVFSKAVSEVSLQLGKMPTGIVTKSPLATAQMWVK